MRRDDLREDYFARLCALVKDEERDDGCSFRKLLAYLHNTEFTYSIPKDQNRAEDGVDLRHRFGYESNDPCSVLEMMVALAIRCEETIMDDTKFGDRTSQWFWGMIANLGLNGMVDARFDRPYVRDAVSRFLNREYDRDGRGGLFRVRNCDRDMRKVEIWYQLCWYLDSIT